MRTFYLLLSIINVTFFISCGNTSINKNKIYSSSNIYIPANLEECFIQIDTILTDSTKNSLLSLSEDEFSARLHRSLGLWMRNNWELWGGSRLSDYFKERGIFHPDDMSGIILTSYYRKKNGILIKLDDQIKDYQRYWIEQSFEEEEKKVSQ